MKYDFIKQRLMFPESGDGSDPVIGDNDHDCPEGTVWDERQYKCVPDESGGISSGSEAGGIFPDNVKSREYTINLKQNITNKTLEIKVIQGINESKDHIFRFLDAMSNDIIADADTSKNTINVILEPNDNARINEPLSNDDYTTNSINYHWKCQIDDEIGDINSSNIKVKIPSTLSDYIKYATYNPDTVMFDFVFSEFPISIKKGVIEYTYFNKTLFADVIVYPQKFNIIIDN